METQKFSRLILEVRALLAARDDEKNRGVAIKGKRWADVRAALDDLGPVANVPLALSAPDLLAALKGMLELHQQPSDVIPEVVFFAAALAAIAKAEGRANG